MTKLNSTSTRRIFKASLLAVSLPMVLVACGGDDDDDMNSVQSSNQALMTQKMELESQISALSSQLDNYDDIQSLSSTLNSIEMQLDDLQMSLDNEALTQDQLTSVESSLDTAEMQLNELVDGNIATYEITVTNVTYNQPVSPVAIMLHEQDYRAWQIGAPASAGLEVLAESGSPAMFLENSSQYGVQTSGDGIVAPGKYGTYTLSTQWDSDLSITLATMLVNTNDAFTGVTGRAIHGLEIGESLTFAAPVYDAGTEFNDELASAIPGPAAGGEGFNEARETRDQVTRHPGVVSRDDGYAESVLDQSHRFDNNPVRVRIVRTL